MKHNENKTIHELAFHLLKQAAAGSLALDPSNKLKLTAYGLWADFEAILARLTPRPTVESNELQEATRWARQTQQYGLNCSMLQQTQRSQEENLRVFITELSTKTLKTISLKLAECDKTFRKALESANCALPPRNPTNTTDLIQLTDSLHSFACKFTNNILGLHRSNNQTHKLGCTLPLGLSKAVNGRESGWKEEKEALEERLRTVSTSLDAAMNEKEKLQSNLHDLQAQNKKNQQNIQQLEQTISTYKAQRPPNNIPQPLDISFHPHSPSPSFHSPLPPKTPHSYCVTPSQFYHIRQKAFSPAQKSQPDPSHPVQSVILECININSQIETLLQAKVTKLLKVITEKDNKLREYAKTNRAYERQIDECLKEELEYRLEIKGFQAREKQYRQALAYHQFQEPLSKTHSQVTLSSSSLTESHPL